MCTAEPSLLCIEKVSMLYDTFGCPAHAAISLVGAIRIYLDEGEYGKAKSSIERYEKESGLFVAETEAAAFADQ